MNRRSFLARLLGTPALGRLLPKLAPTIAAPAALVSPEQFARNFDAWIFPVIRSCAPLPLIQDLVSVQPMTEPAGETLYLEFKTVSKPRNETTLIL